MEYLPDDRTDRTAKSLKRRVGYHVWKRKIARYTPTELDESARILDLGCGAGYLLEALSDWYDAELVGGDVVRDHVRFTADLLTEPRVARFDGSKLPFRESSFDVVFSMQVVEHVPDPDALIAEVARILRPDGVFVMTTPNPDCIAASVLGDDWQGYKHDHISLRTPDEWRTSLTSAGFEIRSDGTTLLTGLPLLGRLPFALLSWLPLAVFGYFQWGRGESYKALAQRVESTKQ